MVATYDCLNCVDAHLQTRFHQTVLDLSISCHNLHTSPCTVSMATPRQERFAKVFFTKSSFLPIHERFLPRKFSIIQYGTNIAKSILIHWCSVGASDGNLTPH
jgi:hypothetical protein